MDIYLVDPNGVELNLTNFGVSSSHFVNEYPKGAFDIAPVEHISRYTADGLPYLDAYRRRPIVVDLKLTAVGSTAMNLWSEIATVLAQARMSKTPCKLKVVEGGKTVYLDVYPESSAVIPSVLSSELTLRLVSYGRWYSGTLRTETLTVKTSKTVSNIAARLQAGWNNVGGGVNSFISAMAVAPDGTLYVGGNFTTAGGAAANYIAKWNGSAWSALGSGMNSYVNALVVAPDGTLYAGGSFATAGGVSANYVAKWNGSTWSALGSGTNGIVNALAVAPDGSLYAGGDFTTAGGVTVNFVAKWNGSAWSALGSGMNNIVSTLAVASDGTLYAGGTFTTAGGITVNYAAKWDGSTWAALGSGVNNNVNVLAVAPDGSLYAGGAFTSAGGNPLSDRAALWNGYRWLPLDIDFPGAPYVNSIVFPNSETVYLGGGSSGTALCSAINTITSVTSEVYPQLSITASTATTVQYIENKTTKKRVWVNYNMLPGETLTFDFNKATLVSSAWGNVLRAVAPGCSMKFSLAKGTNSVWLFVPTGTVTAQLSWYPQYETLAEALQ